MPQFLGIGMDVITLKIMFASIGGFYSRLCGSRSIMPFGLEQWFYAAPYGLILWQYPAVAIPAYIAAVIGKRMGHGQYIHLGKYRQPYQDDEKIDGIIRFFFGFDYGGNYWRCVAGLALSGLIVAIIPSLAYGLKIDPLGGLLMAFGGAAKAFAYMSGHFLGERGIGKSTVTGEILTGVFGWGTIACLF